MYLIPVYLGSVNPMHDPEELTAIHALTNMQIATGMSHVYMPLFPSYSC